MPIDLNAFCDRFAAAIALSHSLDTSDRSDVIHWVADAIGADPAELATILTCLIQLAVTIQTRIEESQPGSLTVPDRPTVSTIKERSVAVGHPSSTFDDDAATHLARRALEEIRDRSADEEFGLRTAARQLRVSSCYLSRVFSRIVGMPFSTYLRGIRLTTAQQLLRHSELTMKEIAAKAGYRNVSGMDRHFRDESGITPKQYRSVFRR
jgi:AraC-like DNA-binding protein